MHSSPVCLRRWCSFHASRLRLSGLVACLRVPVVQTVPQESPKQHRQSYQETTSCPRMMIADKHKVSLRAALNTTRFRSFRSGEVLRLSIRLATSWTTCHEMRRKRPSVPPAEKLPLASFRPIQKRTNAAFSGVLTTLCPVAVPSPQD